MDGAEHGGQRREDRKAGILAQQKADLPTHKHGDVALIDGEPPTRDDDAHAEAEQLRADDDDGLDGANLGELCHAEIPCQADGQHSARRTRPGEGRPRPRLASQ